ncbi:MAG: SRPBCC family protein [Anaerolineaceae bacterium]|nr:SRPBCC family protein [Anaerolineaceae bacterium]
MSIEPTDVFIENERPLALAGGGLCLLLAMRQRSWPGLLLGAVGTGLLLRGLTGRLPLRAGLRQGSSHDIPKSLLPVELKMKETVTVNCAPEEAYRFWRNLENLPHFMTHLETVEMGENGRSHWKVKTPAGITLAWDAQIVADQPNRLIQWRTLPEAAVQHAGQVQFNPAPTGRGTEVTAQFHYEPPGGLVGEAFAYLTNTLTEQLLREEVRRFKHVMETGEVPTIEGQPSARK